MKCDISIRLFGAFRPMVGHGSITIQVDAVATVADLRHALELRLDDDNARALLRSSAFATDERVLDDEHEALPHGANLAVLPPVCGG